MWITSNTVGNVCTLAISRFMKATGRFSSVNEQTLFSPDWSAPPQPWIDPKKEADAWIAMHGAGLMSKSEIVEARGSDMNKLYTDLVLEKETEEKLGLQMELDVTNTGSGSQDEPAAKQEDDEDQAA